MRWAISLSGALAPNALAIDPNLIPTSNALSGEGFNQLSTILCLKSPSGGNSRPPIRDASTQCSRPRPRSTRLRTETLCTTSSCGLRQSDLPCQILGVVKEKGWIISRNLDYNDPNLVRFLFVSMILVQSSSKSIKHTVRCRYESCGPCIIQSTMQLEF
jgi:hypothetical protein